VKIGPVTVTLYIKAEKKSTRKFYIYWSIWVKFDTEDPIVMPLA